MLHTSVIESKGGFRVLDAAELSRVSGGNNSGPEIVVPGSPPPPWQSVEYLAYLYGGMATNPYYMTAMAIIATLGTAMAEGGAEAVEDGLEGSIIVDGQRIDPDTIAPEEFVELLTDENGPVIVVTGSTASISISSETGCPIEMSAAEQALNYLEQHSEGARILIALAESGGVQIETVINDTYANLASNTVYFDPFMAATGMNSDGSTWFASPVVALAHELVHAVFGDNPAFNVNPADREAIAIQIENIILAQLESATGTELGSQRDTHNGTGTYVTSSPLSVVYSIARPGCNG